MKLDIGKHKVSNASIMSDEVDRLFAGEGKASILNIDPPWGEGNMKYWSTLNKRQTGVDQPNTTFSALIDRIMDLANRYVNGVVIIANGITWEEQVAARMTKGGLHGVQTHRIEYRSGSRILPCSLLIGTTSPTSSLPSYTPPSGVIGSKLVSDVIGHYSLNTKPDSIIFDPCCGMGYTARAAIKYGHRFFGNELNNHRLQKTINLLKSKV